MKKLLCVLLAALMLLSLCACGMLDSSDKEEEDSYMQPLDDFMDYITGDATLKTIQRMMPDEAWEYREEEHDLTPDYIWEVYQENRAGVVEGDEEEFGPNLKYHYEVVDDRKLDKDELEDLKEELEYYGIDPDDVKEAYEVDFEATISGDYDEETAENTYTVVKIGKTWYMFDIIDGYLGF